MGHLLTTFFWTTNAFSGTSQLDEGPFFVGTVNKLYRAEVDGQLNIQGQPTGDTAVFANLLAFGLQQIPHGNSPLDVITSADNDSWLIRKQTGSEDVFTTWAPETSTGIVNQTYAVRGKWAGQFFVGLDTDLYLVLKTSNGGSAINFNTFGTIRLWWD